MNPHGLALKIGGLSGLEPDNVVHPLADDSIRLKAWDARCVGGHIRLLSSPGAIGDWSDPRDYISWDFICPAAGTYEIAARYASAGSGAEATVSTPNGTLCWSIATTGASDQFQVKVLGSQRFDHPGRYTLAFRPAARNWRGSFRLAQIQLKDRAIRPQSDGTLSMGVADAVLDGSKFFLESNDGRRNVGGWTDASEQVVWDQVNIAKGGTYEVGLEAVTGGEESVTVTFGAETITGHLPAFEKSASFKILPVGRIQVSAPGVYALEVRPEPAKWQWINLARVVLKPLAE